MPDATSRILVGRVDQLADGVHAIALDVCRHTLGYGDDFPANHEDAVIAAFCELLDDQTVGDLARARPGVANCGLVGEAR